MEWSHFELIVSQVKAMSRSPKIYGTEKTHSLQAGVSLLGSQLEFLSRTSGTLEEKILVGRMDRLPQQASAGGTHQETSPVSMGTQKRGVHRAFLRVLQ